MPLSSSREGLSTLSLPTSSTPAPHAAPLLTNIQKRALTILVVAPSVLFGGLASHAAATAIGFFAVFAAGVEWTGVKRHLKVALLMLRRSGGGGPASPLTTPTNVLSPPLQDPPLVDGLRLIPDEYPLPVTPITLYIILKHLGWASLMWAAYVSAITFATCFHIYFLIFVVVTLTAHNGLELKMEQAMKRLSQQLTHPKQGGAQPTPRSPATLSAAKLAEEQRRYFLQLELHMVAEHQPTEQFLDFCLDIFGILWVTGLACPLLVYAVPNVGVPWIASTMLGNFLNDIAALVVGRSLRAWREKLSAVYDVKDMDPHPSSSSSLTSHNNNNNKTKKPMSEATWLTRLVLRGPSPLYPAISPNKSLEGAVVGTLANALVFAGCMHFIYSSLSPSPDPRVMAPVFQHVGLWLIIGLLMGMLGVIGDLLQSLLKRAARVKDAGFIIPGHGGMLDRIDGLLLVFPFMYCCMRLMMALSAPDG